MGQFAFQVSNVGLLPKVESTLSFIKPQDTKPVFYSTAITGGEAKLCFELEDHMVEVSDMRPMAERLSIDKEGFELLRHRTSVQDLYDDFFVKTDYYAEIEKILYDRFGDSKIAIFDVTRRSDAKNGAQNSDGFRGPAIRVHADYTVKSGPQRAKDVLGAEEFNRFISNGAQILQINLWRPIRGPVKRSPLAVADASSIAQEELVATDQIFSDRVGEIYQVAYGKNQRWYYASDMECDEVLLIKGWDSINDGRAIFTPHGAFRLPNASARIQPRESIEVRTFIVIE